MGKNNILSHHGILGMKWGIRRYQNPDGSLTEAGKRRYHGSSDSKRKQQMRTDVKNRRLLSDEDLKKKIDRIKMEKELRELTDSEISAGKKAATKVLADGGKKAATTMVNGSILYSVKYFMTKKFDAMDAVGYIAPKPKNK